MAQRPDSVLGVARPGWWTEDVALLRDVAERFSATEVMPHYERFEAEGMVDRDLWFKAGNAGLLCAQIPETYGGGGGTYAHDAAITEAFGHTGADGFCLPLHNAITSPYLVRYGSEDQKQRFLPRLATGALVSAICMTEPGGGSDLQAVKTTARREGDHYIVNGSKTFITNGQQANLLIVFVKTDPSAGAKGVSLLLIETDGLPGFERGRNLDKLGFKANDTSELFFNEVSVPTINLLGLEEGRGFYQSMAQLPQERLLIANQAMGMIERALALTLDYVRDRKVFGKRVIDFQNTQFRLAELKSEATMLKVFINHCVGEHLEGRLTTVTASMVKYLSTELQFKVMDQCLQLFGGYGYMNEYPIARMFRDSRVQRIYGGTNEIMKVLISRSL